MCVACRHTLCTISSHVAVFPVGGGGRSDEAKAAAKEMAAEALAKRLAEIDMLDGKCSLAHYFHYIYISISTIFLYFHCTATSIRMFLSLCCVWVVPSPRPGSLQQQLSLAVFWHELVCPQQQQINLN